MNDFKAIRNVGFGICVADAAKEIKEVAAFITNACGGRGAVREAAEMCIGMTIKQI